MVKGLKITAIVFIMLFSIVLVNAFDFDNVQNVKETIGKAGYRDIEIRNAFGIPLFDKVLWSGTLDSNTNSCSVNCEAIQTIVLHEEGVLVEDIIFRTKQGDGSWIEEPIQDYQVYIMTGEIPYQIVDYETQCTLKHDINGTDYESCKEVKVGEHTGYEKQWQEYVLGTQMNPDSYELKLEGQKDYMKTVDWIYKTQGETLEAWAVWSASFNVGLQSYYPFDNNTERLYGVKNLSVLDGQITFVAGLIGNAGEFSVTKSMEILSTTNDLQWNFTANTSVNLWVYKTSAVTSTTILSNFAPWYAYSVIGSSNLAFTGMSAPAISTGNGGVALNTWKMITIVKNDTNVTLYVDGSLNATQPNALSIATVNDVSVGDGTSIGEGNWVGLMDEMGTWNRSLSASEINDLYNGGAGITYIPGGGTNIIQSYPIDYFNTTNNTVGIGCNFTAGVSPISNVSIRLYNTTGDLVIQDNIIGLSDTSYNATWVTAALVNDSYNWSCSLMAVDTSTSFSSNRTLNISNILQVSQTYNSTVYETGTSTFLANTTSNGDETVTADLIYDGTLYAGTKAGDNYKMNFTRTIDIPSGTGNKTFLWSYNYGSVNINSTPTNLTVLDINLSLCGSAGNVSYVNFTFKDEEAGTTLNASLDLGEFDYWIGSGTYTKNFIYQNTTDNFAYAFCFTPNDTAMNTDMSFKYSKTSYPQRTFVYANKELTNTTTNQTLYLLGSGDGIYSSIQTVEASGAPITDVVVQVERQILGIWTLLTQGTTDSSGLVTFWVNPNYIHRLTAVKLGYTTTQVSITPTQSLYTLTMSSTSGAGIYNSSIEGIWWEAYPGSGTLNATNNQMFNVTVYATLGIVALENCRFELLNASNISQILDTVTSITNETYCYLSLTYNTVKDQNLFGRLSIDTDETTGFVIVDTDWKWILLDIEIEGWRTITSFFEELKGLGEFGEGNEAEFSRIVFFFLITTILLGAFVYFSGVEVSSEGASIIIIWALVIIASSAGFLSFSSGTDNIPEFFEQFGFAIITTIYLIGFFLNKLRKSMD